MSEKGIRGRYVELMALLKKTFQKPLEMRDKGIRVRYIGFLAILNISKGTVNVN